jgi:radical SAM-linked protein
MSHLDLMRVMQRAFRRADVGLQHSQGFTPHAYVSMLLPLSVGVESVCEIMDFDTDPPEAARDPSLAKRLNAVLPEGLHVSAVYESARKIKELTHLQAALTLEYDAGAHDPAEIAALLCRDSLIVEKKSKRGVAQTDIRPMIKHCEIKQRGNALILTCTVCAQNPSLNPMLIVKAIERYAPNSSPDFASCRRLEVFDENGDVFR